jgi:hypothetical protein
MRALQFAAAVAARVAPLRRARSRLESGPRARRVLARPLSAAGRLHERMLIERRTLATRERTTERLLPGRRPPSEVRIAAAPAGVRRERLSMLIRRHVRTEQPAAPARGRAVPGPAPSRPRSAPTPRRAARGEPGTPPPVARVVALPGGPRPERRLRDAATRAPADRGLTPPSGPRGSEAPAASDEEPRALRHGPAPPERLDVEHVAEQVLQRLERMATARRERMGAI